MEWRAGEIFSRVGFIVTNLPWRVERVVRFYKKRTACERVNARLKDGMGMSDLHVRGLKNVALSLDLAILGLYGLALGHLKRGARH